MKRLLCVVIDLYQITISPVFKQFFGNACRFNPSCSEFTKQQVQKYGIIKGVRLGFSQLVNCHPFGKFHV